MAAYSSKLVIYKNPEILRSKLPKLEPHQTGRRIGSRTTVVFPVDDNLKFDCNVPVLSEKDIKKHFKLKELGQLVDKPRDEQREPIRLKIPKHGGDSESPPPKIKKRKLNRDPGTKTSSSSSTHLHKAKSSSKGQQPVEGNKHHKRKHDYSNELIIQSRNNHGIDHHEKKKKKKSKRKELHTPRRLVSDESSSEDESQHSQSNKRSKEPEPLPGPSSAPDFVDESNNFYPDLSEDSDEPGDKEIVGTYSQQQQEKQPREQQPQPQSKPQQVVVAETSDDDDDCQVEQSDRNEGSTSDKTDSSTCDKNEDSPNSMFECGSSIDCLVLNGPDEDEFRQYDDEPEDETVISKNLKKIKSTAPLQQPKPPARQVAIQQPPTPSRPTPEECLMTRVNTIPRVQTEKVPAPANETRVEMAPEEISRLLDQGNLLLFSSQLERRVDTLKSNQLIRSSLKKAVFMCLEKDDTFGLLKFIDLVVLYNYSEDMQFWDELIKKVRRKDNPHAKIHTFKCKQSPDIVIRNYHTVIQRVDDFFNLANVKVTLDWHSCIYVMNTAEKMRNGAMNMMSKSANNQPQQQQQEQHQQQSQQENVDPLLERDISVFKDTDGKRKFKIKAPRRKATRQFSIRLLAS